MPLLNFGDILMVLNLKPFYDTLMLALFKAIIQETGIKVLKKGLHVIMFRVNCKTWWKNSKAKKSNSVYVHLTYISLIQFYSGLFLHFILRLTAFE